MKRLIITCVFVFFIIAMKAGDKPAYIIYDSQGKKVDYTQMIDAAAKSEIVLFGEQHNNPIAHWLEYELTKDVYKILKSNLMLGAEMFEADNQIIVSEYVTKLIAYKNFKADARLWPNFETDYKPFLDFARDSSLKFVATNIPRRYAALVNNEGFEGLDKLTADAKKWIAPLPIKYDPTLPGYKKMLEMAAKGGMGSMGNMPGKPKKENLPKAQAIKDATMAYFILSNLVKGKTFIHFQGAYHSDFYDGIYWYLKQAKPEVKILTISTVEQDDISSLSTENLKTADYIICVTSEMTKTYE